ncbi:MAG: hypothetical protein WCY71_08730 [Halothiobacillaceae bacterium]
MNSFPFDEIAARVDAAKEAKPAPGLNRAMECLCPAHQDKRPSLLVSETEDGRVLMHCRAGCSFDDIRQGLGLEPIDLIPEHLRYNRQDSHRAPHRGPRFSAWQALKTLAFQATVVAIAAGQMSRGEPLNEDDHEAVLKAKEEIDDLLRAGGFRP